ncbi:MAG: manganese/zinc/iron transport system permease protein [Abditibacteriota bacterium]|nr:manganese/zinc/iron transport system permease protein [Abditibacteriota bacterium]
MILPSWLWIILIGAMVAASCSVVGSFLVLRRMAMLGDAISHAVLPGIAIAFFVTQSRSSLPMFIGAVVLGLLTAFIVQTLNRSGRVQNDAAIGVSFTSLFALGVILISLYASNVDLDTDCVLYGVLELAPLDTIEWAGRDIGPRAFWQMAVIFAIGVATVALLFKELKITTFDPELATAIGINAGLMHYVLMGLVSITTVGAFEPVGAILVVAMMVVPPATAYLLTDDLKTMLWLGVAVGVLSSFAGYALSLALDSNVAGAMTVAAGGFFALALLFSPRHGVVTKRLSQRQLSRRVAGEDALQALWRDHESTLGTAGAPMNTAGVALSTRTDAGTTQRALGDLKRTQMVETSGEGYVLTEQGRRTAQELVHRHRVYESYLNGLGYPEDHLHDAADRVEHFLPAPMVEEVDEAAGNPQVDPHGKPIPHD